MAKKSFLLHKDSLAVLSEMTDEQAGRLFKAIACYQNGCEYDADLLTRVAFATFKAQFERDALSYDETTERNRINGSKGGRPKTEAKQQEPTKSEKTQSVFQEPKKADSDSDSDSDKDSDNNMIVKRNKKFVSPSLDEVLAFMKEKNMLAGGIWSIEKINLEAKNFWNYYESNGWHVGRTKMKDWNAACRRWMNNANTQKNGRDQKQSELTEYRERNTAILRRAFGQSGSDTPAEQGSEEHSTGS